MYPTLGSLGVSVMFFLKDLNLLLWFIGYDSNSRAYRVFNKDSGVVETTYDAVFDETNGSQVEQYDNDIDDEEAHCDALRKMDIVNVRPQEANEDQPSSNEVAPPTQVDDQNQEGE
jgi:hypothetical protein